MNRARVLVAAVVFVFVVASPSTIPSPASGLAIAYAAPVVAPVRLGDSGPAVTAVQQALAARGYTVAVDGRFGPQTDRAVRRWQTANGLTPDGVVGPLTRRTFRLTPAATDGGPTPRPVPIAASDNRPRGSPEQIIRDVWPDDVEDQALAIAFRESRFVPTVRNACCWGLFQIHYAAHRGWLAGMGVTSPAQLLDPETNARAALALFQAAGWGPWRL